MNDRKFLLDAAMKVCTPPNGEGLASRLGVSRSQISRWKNGHDPMPKDKVMAAAKLAHLDAGAWWLLIERDQATGDVRRTIDGLVKRLGIAATVALCAIALPYFVDSSEIAFASLHLMSGAAAVVAAWACGRLFNAEGLRPA